MLTIEKEIWDKGYNYIACIDEVGRGCLAGSVVACAVIMPKDLLIEGVNDSKKLTAKKRDKMYKLIMDAAVAVGIGEMDCKTVDEINIKNATKLAMMQAIANLRDKEGNAVIPDYLLIDAEKLNLPMPQSNIIHRRRQGATELLQSSIIRKSDPRQDKWKSLIKSILITVFQKTRATEQRIM